MLLILACIICFFVNSFVSLLLFVLLSAYHFGEQHFENKLNTPAWSRFSIFITYGLLIFFMLFYANLSEVNQIVNDLTQQSFAKEFILYGMAINMIFFLYSLPLHITEILSYDITFNKRIFLSSIAIDRFLNYNVGLWFRKFILFYGIAYHQLVIKFNTCQEI